MKYIEAIVDQQIRRWELEKRRPQSPEIQPPTGGPIITVSRQRGSGGSVVAERLAELTGFSYVNREIIDQISHETGAQKRLIESLDESVQSGFQLWVDGILRGRIIDKSDYLQSLVKIIGAIMLHGKSIIVGRGANFIVGGRKGFNVRIIADLDFRIASLSKRRGLTAGKAREEIAQSDQQRKKFIDSHFNRNIDDPAAYDLIINSTYLEVDKVAALIMSSYAQKSYSEK